MTINEYFKSECLVEHVSKSGKIGKKVVMPKEAVDGWLKISKATKETARKIGISAGRQWVKGSVSNTRIKNELSALCKTFGLTVNCEGEKIQFVSADVAYILSRCVKSNPYGVMTVTTSKETIFKAFIVAIHVRYNKGDYSEAIVKALED